MEGYVGFANLPNQVYRKSVKRGFEFTLMVVGESGLGKSTLINSLFLTELYSPEYPGPSHRIKKTVQVEQSKVLVKEGGVHLLLTIVDTPGWQPVIDYIDSKFEDYLNAESRVNRRQMPDSRVQCCLYFIAPSGHGLKPLDIEFMKREHHPLIAKADTMTPEECQQFKHQIMKEIQEHKIKIYEFPETDDEEEMKMVRRIKDRLPLAVVGMENGEHCDFTILRNMLIRTNMQDLKDVTNNVHYENYRSRKLAAVTSPLAQMEEERRDHVSKMKKMEQEMEQVFEMKVKEKLMKLRDSEAELQRRHEQMKKNLELAERAGGETPAAGRGEEHLGGSAEDPGAAETRRLQRLSITTYCVIIKRSQQGALSSDSESNQSCSPSSITFNFLPVLFQLLKCKLYNHKLQCLSSTMSFLLDAKHLFPTHAECNDVQETAPKCFYILFKRSVSRVRRCCWRSFSLSDCSFFTSHLAPSTYVCLCPAEGSTDPPGGEFRDFLCFSSALSVSL
ncbi:hypothetical protein F7725_024709 [Dissostichus mawsoni]|uniref:Septin-7 n=1 Tax=Dissostichus mawsoni TaxID=36200 RepID=A0A7J5X934_DISMA|nr:hypothetical protein F7725_024709 [Dissostichus mawsoni]